MTFQVVRVAEEIELDVHILEYLVEVSMVFGHQLFWRRPLGLGVDNDWGSVSVGAANEQYISTHLPQTPDENICRYVGPEVAYVTRPVSIGQAAGDEDMIASWRQ